MAEVETGYVGESRRRCGCFGHYARERATPKGKGQGEGGQGGGKAKGKGKSARKGGGKGGAVAAVQPPARKRVCLKHDPRAGKTCKDSKCLSELEHLDTTQPFLAERFDKASAAFAAGEARRRHNADLT